MTLEEAVWRDPERMSGELCFRGTRVPVENLFGFLQGGDTLDTFLYEFPGVSREQTEIVLASSFDVLNKMSA